MTKQLEIGPGEEPLPGDWVRIDCRERPGVVDIVCRWGAEPLPFPNASFDLVYASHVLEHIPWYQTIDALREACRVLKPGGALEVHVPDFDTLIRAATSRCCLDDHAESGLNRELHWMHWVAERLFHLGTEDQWHRACFNVEHLAWCLKKAGFCRIDRLESERGTRHGIVNLGMQAMKPRSGEDEMRVEPSANDTGNGVPNDTRDHFTGVAEGLPHCHSRREYDLDEKVYFCAHPKVHAPASLVTAAHCGMCTRWREPPPTVFRPYPNSAGVVRKGPCWYLGEQVGVRECPSCRGNVKVKVFRCDHPNHESTTVKECVRCVDYDLRLGTGTVKQWAVGVTTAPRQEPTLERCLESLDKAGWTEVRLFAEPAVVVPDRFKNLPVTLRNDRLGAWPNWFLALAELYERDARADAYLLVQDDAVFCRKVRAYLERVLWPADRLGVVSLYSPSQGSTDVGFRTIDSSNGLPGALALIFPNVSARTLLGDEQAILHRRRGPTAGTRLIDVVVGKWARRMGLSAYCHAPSLVQHIGMTTTIWPAQENAVTRRSRSFPGEEFEALSLLSERGTTENATDGIST